jgi:signal transduction histidine kinase/CheY-like chemotaxis protein
VMDSRQTNSERALILAPRGRDAEVAEGLLRAAGFATLRCRDLPVLRGELEHGAGLAILTEEAVRTADLKGLAAWLQAQPAWSDLPFVLLTDRGSGPERNPLASRLLEILGNVTFLERPFHPTTLVSYARSALRGRRRQYDARARLEQLRENEARFRNLSETLEERVGERTRELAAANRQLLRQIEERERVEATLRQMQRLEAVGQLTSGVAHDFNNLLTVVIGSVRFFEKLTSDPNHLRRIQMIREAAERGAKLTSQLLAFSRRQKLEPKAIDLNQSIDSMRDLLNSTLGGSVRVVTVPSPELWAALVDPTQIELVILNLAINARDAMPGGGSLTIETENVTLGSPQRPEEPSAGDYVKISVKDTGSGMTEDVLAKAFEPFFTTKEVGKGSGLGLSQVLGFAKQSGGGVRIDTRLGQGTTIEVFLPRVTTGATADVTAPASVVDTAPPTRGAVVLVVDDDSSVRVVAAAMLRELGYGVVEAGSGGGALERLQQDPSISLALLDFAMPGMNGVELARQMLAIRPTLPIMFMTGYADAWALAEVGDRRIVNKPFSDDELEEAIRSTLGQVDHAADSKIVPFRRR